MIMIGNGKRISRQRSTNLTALISKTFYKKKILNSVLMGKSANHRLVFRPNFLCDAFLQYQTCRAAFQTRKRKKSEPRISLTGWHWSEKTFFFVQLHWELSLRYKGQIISKCPFGVFKSPKYRSYYSTTQSKLSSRCNCTKKKCFFWSMPSS